ncbi:hypothetical protein [Saccharothrix sp. HUAS TT1]|uniref:hypothetical protein n=1 Tax=unclassified Saccharothrix TaxID=2593673 RepID=UPI00345C2C10
MTDDGTGRQVEPVIRTAVQHPPLTAGQLTLGYVRAVPGEDALVPHGEAHLNQWARSIKLTLGAMFSDVTTLPPLERRGFRRLQGSLERLRPSGLVTPSTWHISDDRDEVARVLCHLRLQHCLLLVTDTQTATRSAANHSWLEGS